MLLQRGQVVVVAEQFPVRGFHGGAFFRSDQFPRHGPEFSPELIDARALITTEQMVDACVKSVAFSLPGRALSAGEMVHFEDSGFVAVHLSINSGGHSTHPCADNDYFSVGHGQHLRSSCRGFHLSKRILYRMEEDI